MGPCSALTKGWFDWNICRRSICLLNTKDCVAVPAQRQLAQCLGNQHPGTPHHPCELALVASNQHIRGSVRPAYAWGLDPQENNL